MTAAMIRRLHLAVVPQSPEPAEAANAARNDLSPRETEILRLASHGRTAAEIADALQITERTVAFHINNIVAKLGAANKTHAVASALRQGLID